MNCPHCSAEYGAQAAFCVSCGKALPMGRTGPRVLGQHDLAASDAGRSLQMEQLGKQMRTGFRTLLGLSILQLVVGIGCTAMGAAGQFENAELQSEVLGVGIAVSVIGTTFFGLAMWARRSPLPASVTGLVLLGSLWVLDAIADPTQIARGLLIKIIIVGLLIRAIHAGVKHRALKRQIEQEQPAVPHDREEFRQAA